MSREDITVIGRSADSWRLIICPTCEHVAPAALDADECLSCAGGDRIEGAARR